MVMDPNDKQRHKPSPKHTLDEVRKSLEDMVRNEFDDVAAEGSENTSAAESSPADETAHTHGSLQSLLPRHKPVGIDTEQLLRSLKGLISHELAEGGNATGETEQTNIDMETEPSPPPVDAMVTQETPPADATTTEERPVTAEPVDENAVAPNEAENVTLGTPSEDDVPEVDLSSEFEGEAELLELEAMAEALAEEAQPPPLATKVETANVEPEPTEAGPIAVVEPEVTRSAQSSSLPPSLRVVDLPHTGTLKAFAVYDPALGGEPDIAEVVRTEPQEQTATVSEAPVFVSQWLDELSRQPSYSELGLLERAKKPTLPTTEPSAADLEDDLTIDLPAVTAAPTDISDDLNAPEAGVVNPQDKSKAKHEPPSEPVVPSPQWTDMDNLEIPGAEQGGVDVSAATSQSGTAEDDDTGIQLALDMPEETEQSPESEPPGEESAPVQSDEIAEVDLEAIDTGPDADDLQSDETKRAEKEKTELTLASDDTSTTAEPAGESPPGGPASSIVGPHEQESVNMPSIDFGGDAPTVGAEESVATGHESTGPIAPSDAELKLTSSPAMEPRQPLTELSLADGPLLGPSGPQEPPNDSVTIDLDEQVPGSSDGSSAPPPKEPHEPSPSAKKKAPTTPVSGGIIARRRETPGVRSDAPKEKSAPKRDKPPREIKTEKDSSVAKSESAPLALSDEPAPAPKSSGPAVFKLSDEPAPPAKEGRMPPTVRDKAPAVGAKPSPETKGGSTAPARKEAHAPPAVKEKTAVPSSGAKPSPETKRGTTAPASTMGPAVFKLSDEPVPPAKEAHVPPAAKEKASTTVGRENKPEDPSASARRLAKTAPKSPGGTPPARPRAPASKGDDIPVLEDAVASADRLRVSPAPLASPTIAPAPSTARGAPAKDTAGTRNLAVQVVAKLNTELRKCGERALSPATVDRLQYLLREVLERGAAAVDNNRKKR